MRPTRIFLALMLVQVALATGISRGVEWADRTFPPPLEQARIGSRELRDRDGKLLRAFATADGRWRLNVTAKDVDPQFIRMLIAYEDQRFMSHGGIDPMAIGRAAWQFVTHGRIISGGSTLSMQVARLIEPRQERSMFSKLRQMARAIQIERRMSKEQILDLYLNLAPYGGNLEGVRAASLAYFGKEPRRLAVAESALLVALPQLPERRRPDRHLEAAKAARERVLNRLAVATVIGDGEAERAHLVAVPTARRELPSLAPHLAEAAIRKNPSKMVQSTTINGDIQRALEDVARDASRNLGPRISVAIMMADAKTGEILAEVGSANYFDASRSGWIDMTRVLRSPGSTLKPLIYGLAFEEGMIAQETIIEDRPADFGGYRPKNFDMSYQGDVTVRQALQKSLNVPAVRLLDAVGPLRMLVRFRKAGVHPMLPAHETPGLAIALGGVGVTLKDLVQLYCGLANRGRAVTLGDGIRDLPALSQDQILDPAATWQVSDILSGMRPPTGAADRGLAYKTGTSYGYRDAWTIGFDGRHVIGVWVGRADNAAVPGLSGFISAAPILFEAFERSGVGFTAMPKPPTGAVRLAEKDLPSSLKRFALNSSGLVTASARESAPEIVFPPEGAKVDLALGSAEAMALTLKLQGGRPPFRWLANGQPLADTTRKRNYQWVPDGSGYSTLTVIDSIGRAATVRVFLN